VLKTSNGYVNGVYICHHRADTENLMITTDDTKKSIMDINDVHTMFGHINKDSIYETAAHYNFKVNGALNPCISCSLTKIKQRKVNGALNPCISCSLTKIKQRNIPKTTENKSTIPGKRLFLDIT
jgi:hypothetical protein